MTISVEGLLSTGRFVKNNKGQIIDTHPKIRKAQEEYYKKTSQTRERETRQK